MKTALGERLQFKEGAGWGGAWGGKLGLTRKVTLEQCLKEEETTQGTNIPDSDRNHVKV